MIPAAFDLTHKLIDALDAETALTAHYADQTVVPFELTSIRKRIRILTDDLKAALATPVGDVIKPYSRWNDGVVR